MRIITRDEIARKLRDWAADRISSEDIYAWANALFLSDDVGFEDWEMGKSVSNETLGVLDMLDMNLVIPEDAAVLLEFLTTAPSNFHVGCAKMGKHFDGINYDIRREKLRDIPLYAPFCADRKKA